MFKICLVFWKSDPQYAYKRYVYKKKTCTPPKKYEGLNSLCHMVN